MNKLYYSYIIKRIDAVIDSCETLDQLYTADTYCDLLIDRYKAKDKKQESLDKKDMKLHKINTRFKKLSSFLR